MLEASNVSSALFWSDAASLEDSLVSLDLITYLE
jgi:hypothetical protein